MPTPFLCVYMCVFIHLFDGTILVYNMMYVFARFVCTLQPGREKCLHDDEDDDDDNGNGDDDDDYRGVACN